MLTVPIYNSILLPYLQPFFPPIYSGLDRLKGLKIRKDFTILASRLFFMLSHIHTEQNQQKIEYSKILRYLQELNIHFDLIPLLFEN